MIVSKVIKEEAAPKLNKYSVRPPKDLRSKYELKMEERRMKQLADEEEELRRVESERLRVRSIIVIPDTCPPRGCKG